MASAVIGALRVVLGADTAQFDSGLKGAQGKLDAFGKKAAIAGAAIATAVVAAGTALGVAVKRTINDMDEMGKAAQKFGIPVGELTKLRYAADLAGVGFDSLTAAAGKLAKNMAEVAAGAKGPAAQAFKQLGIDVQNSDGTLKSATEVMTLVSGRFASMQDGAAKTALAMQMFGKSGAQLIPLLNSGASGLAKMFTEAEKLGIVFDTETAKSAERFNDALTTLSALWDGFLVQVAAALAGPLADMAEALKDSAVEGGKLKTAGEGVGKMLADLAIKAVTGTAEIRAFAVATAGALEAAYQFTSFDWSGGQATLKATKEDVAAIRKEAAQFIFDMKAAAADREFESLFGGGDQKADPVGEDLAAKTKEASAAAREFQQIMAEGQRVFEATRTPAEAYSAEVARLSELLKQGAIDADTFGRAQGMAATELANNYMQVASTAATALGSLFEDNKSVAIASAIINTLEGITAAFKLPFPLNWAQAAAVAAAGYAQVAKIRSTTKSSKGGAASVPSSGSRGGASGATESPASGTGGGADQQQRAIIVQGIDPNSLFRGDMVRSMFEAINTGIGNGFRIVAA